MGGFGCYEDLRCYKTFESEKNLMMHIAVVHKEGKEDDFRCNQCGEQFNKLTSHKIEKLDSRRDKKGKKALLEKHLWIHKVTDFECNCDNVPVLQPGKLIKEDVELNLICIYR